MTEVAYFAAPFLGGLCILDYGAYVASGDGRAIPQNTQGTTLAHEVGHALGLAHIFQDTRSHAVDCAGSSCVPAPGCATADALCTPRDDDFNSGDFIADTPVSPSHTDYDAPGKYNVLDTQIAGACVAGPDFPKRCEDGLPYTNISEATKNIMSYSNEVCQTMFTPYQVARMRCHIDRYLSHQFTSTPRKTDLRAPGPVSVVVARRAMATAANVTVAWTPTLNLLTYPVPPTRPTTIPLKVTTGIKYVIERLPAFDSAVNVDDTFTYLDTTATNTSITYQYRVFANNAMGDGAKTAFVQTSVTPGPDTDSSSGLSVGAIFSIVLAGLVVIAVVVCLVKRHQRRQQS